MLAGSKVEDKSVGELNPVFPLPVSLLVSNRLNLVPLPNAEEPVECSLLVLASEAPKEKGKVIEGFAVSLLLANEKGTNSAGVPPDTATLCPFLGTSTEGIKELSGCEGKLNSDGAPELDLV